MKKTSPILKFFSRRLFGGAGGDTGFSNLFGIWPFLPGSSFDYRTEAGALWENSVVLAAINWLAQTIPEAPLGVVTPPEVAIQEDDPAALLLANPNPDLGANTLWAAAILGLVVDGNAYWRKVRSRSGLPVELWPVSQFQIQPIWPRDGSAFISGYRLKIDGRTLDLPKEDVIHFRHTVPDPANPRKGLSPLQAALREICTDNESATYTAALLRNSGVPGALISPDPTGSDNREVVFEQRQREDLAALWKAKFTGDKRGEPLVVPIPMRVQPFSFNPQQMLIDRATDRPEERICALLGIPPVVLGLGTGLRNSNTKASYEESRRAAYESAVIPMQESLARQLTRQLLPDFSADGGRRFAWNRSQVEILRESEDGRFHRAATAFQAAIITREEARAIIGLNS